MASLYQRDRSPYWWIEYINTAGERRQESTKYRYDVTAQSRKAQELRAELSTREIAATLPTREGAESWAAWVPRLIAQRYAGGNRLTRIRYEAAWRNIESFLRAKEIVVPRLLTRNEVRTFLEWRRVEHSECGVHKAAKNTALLEIKFLGIIMDEAMAAGFCRVNPCHKLGVGRDEPDLKPPITMEEHRFITRALKREPEWMRVSYKIAWEQGCRFSETCLPLTDVNLATNTLRLRTKGQKKRVAEVPLSPRLRPLFRRLIGERPGFLARSQRTEVRGQKREFTFEMPAMPGKAWWSFFQRIELRHLCFHCTRVTFITRCYEAGIPEPDVMRLALHSSTTVHRIYPRLPAGGAHLQGQMLRLHGGQRSEIGDQKGRGARAA